MSKRSAARLKVPLTRERTFLVEFPKWLNFRCGNASQGLPSMSESAGRSESLTTWETRPRRVETKGGTLQFTIYPKSTFVVEFPDWLDFRCDNAFQGLPSRTGLAAQSESLTIRETRPRSVRAYCGTIKCTTDPGKDVPGRVSQMVQLSL